MEEAIPQIKEMAASGGAINDRFEVVLESMNLALELKEATNNPSGQPSQTWRSFQQKILAKLAATKTSKSWQHLATLEADFAEELKKSVEQNLKIAMEHEEEVRQKQQLLQQGQAQEHLEQCRQNLLAVCREDGLKDKTQTGLKKCLAKMKHLHEAMQKVEVPSPYCSEAWNLGRAAVQQFSETRLRCSKAFKWLQDKQLGFCARLLDSCGLLEQLHLLRLESQKVKMVGRKLRIHWFIGFLGCQLEFEAAILFGHPEYQALLNSRYSSTHGMSIPGSLEHEIFEVQKKQNPGLPYRCEQLLFAAAEKDALSKDTFGPKLDEIPQGWESGSQTSEPTPFRTNLLVVRFC